MKVHTGTVHMDEVKVERSLVTIPELYTRDFTLEVDLICSIYVAKPIENVLTGKRHHDSRTSGDHVAATLELM